MTKQNQILENEKLESGMCVLSRLITTLTLGEAPEDEDIITAKRMGINLELMKDYLDHVRMVTDNE